MNNQNAIVVCVMFGCLSGLANAQDKPSPAPTQIVETSKPTRPSLLLVDQSIHPKVQISWMANGEPHVFSEIMEFTAPVGGVDVGKNVKGYITMGGSRIETGAGHPDGAVIRLGITKIENARAFFTNIDPYTSIEFAVIGVQLNQPVKYHEGTGMMHLKYSLGDLQACSLPGTARNQYLLSDPKDTLGGRVIPGENATPGALDGAKGHGEFIIEIDKDNPSIISMRVRVPYAQLRHLQDPWMSELPGTFFEPIHLHAEAEFIPVDVEPLNRDPILPEINKPATDRSDDQEKSDQEQASDE